ncbi:MAG: DUF2493 domain-containing protein [Amylibacter sp.]
MHSEIEPLAHGLATLFYRRKVAIEKQLDKHKDALGALVRVEDGSEIHTTQIEDEQNKVEALHELQAAIETMFETAASCYELETNKAFIPPSGGRSFKTAHMTGAMFEAKAWLEADEAEKAKQFIIEGRPLAVAGDRDWDDIDTMWDMLDRIRARYKNSYNSDLILYHKADKKGVDAIAAAWARNRKVPQVTFQPNWRAHGKSAGFKAIDQMLDTPKKLGGVVIFGKTGIALNLADKAEAKGVKAMRVAKAT